MRLHSIGLALAASIAIVSAAAAQEKVPFGVLTFPTVTNTTSDIIKAKGFDLANGLEMIPTPYGTPGAQYAGMAKGEIDAAVISPFQLAQMHSQGVGLSIFATLIGLADIQVVTRTPEVKTFADLKGRSLAATVGFSEFQYMEIYARKMGLDLRKDVTLVDATTALAQAQLQAQRVDAAILWEPSATQALRAMPDLRVILRGDVAWQAVSGGQGWDVVVCISTEWAKAHPALLPRLVKTYQDYEAFMLSQPDAADAIITSGKYTSKGLPTGIIADAIKGKRLVPDVHASWEPETNKQLWATLQLGVTYKEMPALPPRDAIINELPGK
jgi:NitT/TauT family transport system substrate-binding protein